MAEKFHPGITMHKLSFGSGFVGLLFAAGSALIFVLGFPTLWYFVLFAFMLGVAIAVLLRIVNRQGSERHKPLSILATSQDAETLKSRERMKWHKSFKIELRPTSV